jgi:dTDP-4-dehydrorhamnose 3,5-epimerase
MEVRPTAFAEAKLIVPVVHADARGFFCEVYRRDLLQEAGIVADFVQDNHSRSRRGVLRGLHLQVGAGMAKLVRCARGEIFDVIVDARPSSPTYGRWESFVLDDESHHQLFVPVGFAHGFCTLSETADVIYGQTAYYAPELERSVAYNDPDLAIAWPAGIELIVSERDRGARTLREQEDELRLAFPVPAG